MLYEPHTSSLRRFKFFPQQLRWFWQLRSCFIGWYEKKRSIKPRPYCIHNSGSFEPLNSVFVSGCKMFTICDIRSPLPWASIWRYRTRNKTKSANKLSIFCNSVWKSSPKLISWKPLSHLVHEISPFQRSRVGLKVFVILKTIPLKRFDEINKNPYMAFYIFYW